MSNSIKPHGYVQCKALVDEEGTTKEVVYSGFIDDDGDFYFFNDEQGLGILVPDQYEVIADHRHEFYYGQKVWASNNGKDWYETTFYSYKSTPSTYDCLTGDFRYCRLDKPKLKLSELLDENNLTKEDIEVDI